MEMKTVYDVRNQNKVWASIISDIVPLPFAARVVIVLSVVCYAEIIQNVFQVVVTMGGLHLSLQQQICHWF